MASIDTLRQRLLAGQVIPACPLALTRERRLDERRQRALLRYYIAAGAGGVAVAVHTTQFAIRDPGVGLFQPLLELAAEELSRTQPPPLGAPVSDPAKPPPSQASPASHLSPILRIGGICGQTAQAAREAAALAALGFDAGLLSLAAFPTASDPDLILHCAEISRTLPIIGFYLQAAVGGRSLSYSFWRRFLEIPSVVAIKIAPFNRYQTLDVLRAVADSGRADVALYTGNDDNILLDLLTPWPFHRGSQPVELRIRGGLLGHWAVWTQTAVDLHRRCLQAADSGQPIPPELLRIAAQVTDCNAAFFDAANRFAGCIPGLHEILRRQGLLEGLWCLDPAERLSPGQLDEIDRVHRSYPHLSDDDFVRNHLDQWLR